MATGGSWPASSICLGAWRGNTGLTRPRMLRCFGQRRPHVLVSAPSGAGKTWAVVYPTLLCTWFRSAIVLDIKGEIYAQTVAERARFSHVVRFAPGELVSAGYNPLNSIRPGPFAILDANNIAELMPYDDPDYSGEKIWDTVAKNYFSAGALWAVSFGDEREKCLSGLASLFTKGKVFGTAMIENRHPDPDVRRFIRESAEELWGNESERYVGSVLGTLSSYLVPYREPVLGRNTRASDFVPSDLMCRQWPVTLYLCISVPDMRRMRPLLRIMISQILAELQSDERCDRDGQAKLHPLLWALDEFPELEAVADMASALSKMRSFGMRALLGVQTFDQIEAIYGRHSSIFNNVRMIVTRQNWVNDGRIISEMIGEAPEMRESVSRSADPMMGTTRNVSRSRSEGWRRLMQVADVGRLPDDRLLIFGEEKVIKAWRTPPSFWQPKVAPPPAMTHEFDADRPWSGIRYPTVQIQEIEQRMRDEQNKAAASPKPKAAPAKPVEKPTTPARRTRL